MRHGKDEEEKRDKERTRDDGKLGKLDTSSIFYNTIQEHLHKEWTLAELDTWLCTYRNIIIQSKKNAIIEKEKASEKTEEQRARVSSYEDTH